MTEQRTLRVDSLSILVGSRPLLDGVSFDAEPGQIIGVVGPNGAGKSTLLETLVGLRLPSVGFISVGGKALSRFADFAATYAFLPDGGELPAEAHVELLVRHVMTTSACRPVAVVNRLRAALALEPLLKQPAGVLSRGERQRIQLFCVLAQDRPIVVLDEPFGVFDPLQLVRMLEAVKEIAATGVIVVAAVHQLADAEKVADKILILDGGRRLAFGSLAALRIDAGLPGATLEQIFLARLARGEHAA